MFRELQQAGEILKMKLAIGVAKGHSVEARGRETGPQSCAVAPILRMSQEAYARSASGFLMNDTRRFITASVIYYEDFIICGEARKGFVRLGDGLADAGGFVVRGKD